MCSGSRPPSAEEFHAESSGLLVDSVSTSPRRPVEFGCFSFSHSVFFFLLHQTEGNFSFCPKFFISTGNAPPPLPLSPSTSVVKVCLESQSQRRDPAVPTLTASFSGPSNPPTPLHSASRCPPTSPPLSTSCQYGRWAENVEVWVLCSSSGRHKTSGANLDAADASLCWWSSFTLILA